MKSTAQRMWQHGKLLTWGRTRIFSNTGLEVGGSYRHLTIPAVSTAYRVAKTVETVLVSAKAVRTGLKPVLMGGAGNDPCEAGQNAFLHCIEECRIRRSPA